MPSKKKKYNARFPPARIKKIMQKDEEVGKVASTVPVMISRLLELFTESLILKTNELTLSVNARTLTTGHLKQIILSERKFDFLKDLVTHLPDVQANDEDGGDSNSDQGVCVRPRGRPRKKKDEVSVPKKRGRKPKAVAAAAAAAAAPSNDYVGDEGVTDGSETEDADSCSDEEDGESMGEDTAVDAGGASYHQGCKRQCVEDAFSFTCSTTSSAHRVGTVGPGASDTLATASSASVSLANKRKGETFRSDYTASCSSDVPTTFRNAGAGKTVNETCLPLNLTVAGSAVTAINTAASALDFAKEKAGPRPLLPHLRQLPMRINVERTAFDASNGGLLVSPGLCTPRPPPAHRPPMQASGTSIVPSSMLSFNVGMNLFPPAASEFLPQSNSTDAPLACGTVPVSSGSLVREAPIGSQVLSDGKPPVTVSTTTSSSCGHAVHRMPIVPASFLPGAILARSMSVPHSCRTSKPSSLVISPEDDYDS